MQKRLVVMMVLLAVVSLVIGAQSLPQFDVMPHVPTVGEPTSFISWFPPGHDVYWNVNDVPAGTGQTIQYVFPSIGTYSVGMEVFRGPHLVYAEGQAVQTQYSPPGYSPNPPVTVSSTVVGAQSPPQFDVMPHVPTVGEPTSFISWFPPGHDVYWNVNDVPAGTGQTIQYVFPAIGTYSVGMEVFQGPHPIYAERQVVQTQYSPPGYSPSPPETPYVPPETPYVPPEVPSIDTGDFSPTSIMGLLFLIVGALLLFLEQ